MTAAPAIAPSPRSHESAEAKVDILIVDDSPAKLLSLEAILTDLGQNLVCVSSGREALRRLLKQDFAVILLDVSMPDIDGFETASLIRRRPRCEHTPIIFVSAINRTETHASLGYSLGAVDYIFTPIVPEVLRAKVSVFVELFKQTQQIQRQAEQLRLMEEREHQRRLQETNERLKIALEAGRMGAWEWEIRTGRVSWSPSLEQIHGVPPGPFGGTFEDFERDIYADDRPRVRAAIERTLHERTDYELEYRIIRPDGQLTWLEARGRLFLGDDGQPERMTGVCMDISERKAAEAELTRHRDHLQELVDEQTDALRQSLEQLRRSERLASIGTFAAGIAHEINNPLNSILLAAQCALRGPADQDSAEAFRIIAEAAQRGGRIVHGILTFARGIQTEKSPDSLNHAARRAADLVRGYLRPGAVAIETDLCSDLPSIEMNATEIEQVIINLVKNAAEAAERRTHVIIRTEACGDRVRLTVQDDGPGVPAEQLPFIFDPFYTTKQTTGGTGLGLSICHGIITEHGGTIGVESQVGAGTRFTIEFPAIAYASCV